VIYGATLGLGGQYNEILTKNVTHIIALNEETVDSSLAKTDTDTDLSQEKCQQALKRPQFGIKIILPHWYAQLYFSISV